MSFIGQFSSQLKVKMKKNHNKYSIFKIQYQSKLIVYVHMKCACTSFSLTYFLTPQLGSPKLVTPTRYCVFDCMIVIGPPLSPWQELCTGSKPHICAVCIEKSSLQSILNKSDLQFCQ